MPKVSIYCQSKRRQKSGAKIRKEEEKNVQEQKHRDRQKKPKTKTWKTNRKKKIE